MAAHFTTSWHQLLLPPGASSVHYPHSLPMSQFPPPYRPSKSQGGFWEPVCVGREEEELSDVEDHLPNPSPTFLAMINFICKKFPEACGPATQDSAPLLPGMQWGEAPAITSHFMHSQPIDFMMSQASQALVHTN